MARRAIIAGLFLLFAVMSGAALFLKTPAPAPFDREAALAAAQDYQARIIRDAYGVPHIYGPRDADVAFGLAYAHAQDDWKTIEEVLFFSRGALAEQTGRNGAIPDFLMHALRVSESVRSRYEVDLSARTRAIAEAYAAGANLYCAEDKARCAPGAAPVTGQDIVAGFVSRTPFFYGLDETLINLFEGEVKTASEAAREAFLKAPNEFERGSNAMAVAPSRSADGHTRLMVNSHQPYEGPVAWYEARLKSEEGWDMVGALFPGAPMILHGAGPRLGWAFTVNKPDLVDVYALTVDNAKKPTQYLFDGEWRDFETSVAAFRVKLFGPFSLPVKRPVLHSVHGPAFVTDKGVFAVSFAGDGDIRSIEQWFRLNKAENYDEWRAAMAMLAIPSFNVVYADGGGEIAYHYNAALPIRKEGVDWTLAQSGEQTDLLWQGVRDFSEVPSVVAPSSGYVINANNMPFEASAVEDSPLTEEFPPHYGVDRLTTNRGIRIQALYGGDTSITADEFVNYKFDHFYAEDSRVMRMVRSLVGNPEANEDASLKEALSVLASWNGEVTVNSRAAPLAILSAQRAHGPLLNGVNAEADSEVEALHSVVSAFEEEFGRVDPQWGDVVRLKRGALSLPLNGGPDTLRAVYAGGDPADGVMKAVAGDTYILYADWAGPGDAQIKTIHQYGAATLDETSPHYGDQAQLFVDEGWKTPPMALDDLLREATEEQWIGNATAE